MPLHLANVYFDTVRPILRTRMRRRTVDAVALSIVPLLASLLELEQTSDETADAIVSSFSDTGLISEEDMEAIRAELTSATHRFLAKNHATPSPWSRISSDLYPSTRGIPVEEAPVEEASADEDTYADIILAPENVSLLMRLLRAVGSVLVTFIEAFKPNKKDKKKKKKKNGADVRVSAAGQ